MIRFVKALVYFALHPFEPVYYTVVRRYVDAQKRFIGELYEGQGRVAKMIGMSCDNLPFVVGPDAPVSVRWGIDFLAQMPADTVLVGAAEPQDNASVHEYVALRRFCQVRVTVLNRFVERVLESDYV